MSNVYGESDIGFLPYCIIYMTNTEKKHVLEKLHASLVPRFKKGTRLGACLLCSYQEFITIRGSYTLFLKLFSPASVISPSPHTSGTALCMCVCTLVCLFAAIYLLNVFHEDRARALCR